MLEFFIDNVFAMFDGRAFQQKIIILKGTNCAHLLADLIQGLLTNNENNLSRSCNFTFRYIDDVLSLYNSKFCDFVDRIYPIALEILNTTDTARSKLTVRSVKKTLFIYIYQHFCSIWIGSMYFSVDPIFQNVWLLSWFSLYI